MLHKQVCRHIQRVQIRRAFHALRSRTHGGDNRNQHCRDDRDDDDDNKNFEEREARAMESFARSHFGDLCIGLFEPDDVVNNLVERIVNREGKLDVGLAGEASARDAEGSVR